MTRNNTDFESGKQKWYHGSGEDLPVGTILTPGSTRNVNNFLPEGDNSNVWLAKTPLYAFNWGSRAKRRGTVHVYEVTPHENPIDEGNKGSRTSGATILSKVYSGKAKI